MGRKMLSKPEQGLYWCGCCKSLLPKEVFSSSKSRPSGLSARCKPCASKLARDWALANEDSAKISLKRYTETA